MKSCKRPKNVFKVDVARANPVPCNWCLNVLFRYLQLFGKSGTQNRQFQLLIYARRGGWEVRYHIADYAEKIKMVAVIAYTCKY